MSANVFNRDKGDYHKPSLFLGERKGLMDTVNNHYPTIQKLYKAMKKQDWDELEFDFAPCNLDFKTCSPDVYDAMILTLGWQWEADSSVAHTIAPLVAPLVSGRELWSAWLRITDNECLTPDHEVLTPNGWVLLNTVTTSDLVAQWNDETNQVDFVNPTSFIDKEYEGPMHFFKGDQVSQITTPKHRMPIVHPLTGVVKDRVALAKDVVYDCTNGLPLGGRLTDLTIGMSHVDKLIAFIGFSGLEPTECLAGSAFYTLNCRSADEVKYIKLLASRANWTTDELDENKLTLFIPINLTKEVKTKLKLMSNGVLWRELNTITNHWASEFIECVRFWSTPTTLGETTYYSDNEDLCDLIVTLAHLSGGSGKTTLLNDPTKFVPRVKVVIGEVNIAQGSNIRVEILNYSGRVYCLTVPSSFFLVRHNGIISVTGNCTHALTYSEIIRCSFDNPNEVIETILSNNNSIQRLEGIAKLMGEVYEVSHRYALGELDDRIDYVYDHALMFTIALLFLERLQFMASFAVTFSITKTGIFLPIGNAVQKIAQDEIEIHSELDKEVIRLELATERGRASYARIKDRMTKVLNEVVQQECIWTDYLFSEGRQLLGLTPKLLKEWVGYNAKAIFDFMEYEVSALSLDALELDALPTKNPLKFMEAYIDISKNQPSPQEEDIGAYKVNILQRNDDDVEFDTDF